MLAPKPKGLGGYGFALGGGAFCKALVDSQPLFLLLTQHRKALTIRPLLSKKLVQLIEDGHQQAGNLHTHKLAGERVEAATQRG